MAELSRRAGTRLVVMVWPQARLGRWNDDVIEGVRALANAGGVIALTGVDDVLAKLPAEQVVIPDDGHPSAVAHRAVGRYLADAVGDLLLERQRLRRQRDDVVPTELRARDGRRRRRAGGKQSTHTWRPRPTVDGSWTP
jgi:hypothetical protein